MSNSNDPSASSGDIDPEMNIEIQAENPVSDINAAFDDILKHIKGPQKRAEIERIKTLPDADRLQWLMTEDDESAEIAPRSTGAIVCVYFIIIVVVVAYYVWVVKTTTDKDGKKKKVKQQVKKTRNEKRKKRVECEAGPDGKCEAPED